MHTYILSLGSNIAPRLQYLRFGLCLLSRRGEMLACSSAYETSPVGMRADDGPFLNCAIRYSSCILDPRALLRYIKEIEERAGRDLTERYKPRPLDIDIIVWSGGEWRDEYLVIPHPRAHERLFVIAPYAEICAGPGVPAGDAGDAGDAGAQKLEERSESQFFCSSDAGSTQNAERSEAEQGLWDAARNYAEQGGAQDQKIEFFCGSDVLCANPEEITL